MHKEIERAVLRITQAMEKNRKNYDDANASYKDTGYDRYWKKMEKLDAEYEELRSFMHPKEEINISAGTIQKLDELQRNVKNIRSKWENLRRDLPYSSDSVGIDDIFRDIKTLLN